MSGWRPNVLLKCHTPKIQTPGLPLKPAAPHVSLRFVNSATTYSSARKTLQAFFPLSLFSYYVWCIGMACFFQIHPNPDYFLSMPPLPAWLWCPIATDLCTVVSALNVLLLLGPLVPTLHANSNEILKIFEANHITSFYFTSSQIQILHYDL